MNEMGRSRWEARSTGNDPKLGVVGTQVNVQDVAALDSRPTGLEISFSSAMSIVLKALLDYLPWMTCATGA